MRRSIRLLAPILLVALAAFLAGNAAGSEGNPPVPVASAQEDWKGCLDERIADYDLRDLAAWPAIEECFRQ